MNPMLCSSCTIEEARELFKTGMWQAERKFDGVRAYIIDGKLFDRRGKDITKQFPEFNDEAHIPDMLRHIKGTFDGEIVAMSGIFEDVSGRMHMRDPFQIKMCAKMQPAVFVAFDRLDSVSFLPTVLKLRKDALMMFMSYQRRWMVQAPVYTDVDYAWSLVEENGWEGLVIKRISSPYQEGVRSPDWRKIKSWKEEIAEFTKYEIHPRGITIEDDAGRRVVVNGAQAEELIERFKKDGKIKAEIQYLPQKSGVWRFPSFRKLVEE